MRYRANWWLASGLLVGGLLVGGCSQPMNEAQQAQEDMAAEVEESTGDALRDINEESEPADDAADEAVAQEGEADTEVADGVE